MQEDLFHLGAKALIQNKEGSVLLVYKVKSDKSFWELPGGRVNREESLNQGLIRELDEELGLTQTITPFPLSTFLTKSRIRIPDGDVGLVLSVFQVKSPEGFIPQLSSEHTQYGWFNPTEASKLLTSEYAEDFIELVKNLDSLEDPIES